MIIIKEHFFYLYLISHFKRLKMIQPGTQMFVSDNSGARKVECIRILGRTGRSPGSVGDIAVVSVKELRKKGNIKVKKKEVCLALILRVSKSKSRIDGRQLFFDKNTCVLLNLKRALYGTRIFGPIMKEFRAQSQFKLLALSSSHF
jgi:large subunit ribosomal protein L14